MTGVEYWRCKRRLSRSALVKRSGVSEKTLHRMEEGVCPTTKLSIYMDVARALDVPIDELARIYAEEDLESGDRPACRQKAQRDVNCIAVYRRVRNLTHQQLVERLGAHSREWSRQVCSNPRPNKKALLILAKYEGITVEEFERRYAVSEGRCA